MWIRNCWRTKINKIFKKKFSNKKINESMHHTFRTLYWILKFHHTIQLPSRDSYIFDWFSHWKCKISSIQNSNENPKLSYVNNELISLSYLCKYNTKNGRRSIEFSAQSYINWRTCHWFDHSVLFVSIVLINQQKKKSNQVLQSKFTRSKNTFLNHWTFVFFVKIFDVISYPWNQLHLVYKLHFLKLLTIPSLPQIMNH